MRKVLQYIAGCALFLSSGAVLTMPQTVPSPPTHDPLLKPLEQGNSDAVHGMEKRYGAGPLTRAMDQAQLNYNFPHLSSAALRCQDRGLKGNTEVDLSTALYCSHLVRASALIEGDALAYLQEAMWVKDILFPDWDRVANVRLVFGTGLDSANLHRLTRSTPAVTETWLKESQVLPFLVSRNPLELSDAPPAVNVRVNGRVIPAFIGMSRGTLLTPVTVIEPKENTTSISSRLKLKLLVRNYAQAFVKLGDREYPVTASLYLADKARVGPLLLHHVVVGVLTSSLVLPGVYLSASMWRRFGEVTISNGSIRLSRRETHRCAHGVPMTFAANYLGVGSLHFRVRLNSTPMVAVLSLHANDAIDVAATAWTDKRNDVSDGVLPVGQTKQPTVVQIGDRSFNATVHILKHWVEPFQASLGRSILRQNTVHLMLRGGTPSICFAPTVDGVRGHGR